MNELEQILLEVIRKTDWRKAIMLDGFQTTSIKNIKLFNNGCMAISFVEKEHWVAWHINELLFDPEFGKKFWGNYKVCKYCGARVFTSCDRCGLYQGIEIWQYHFSQQVQLDSNEDRIRYLKKGL